MMENPFEQSRIVFFDGICILCNRSVDFIMKRDRKKQLKFVSLQSDFAKDFPGLQKFISSGMDTVIYYDRGNIYIKSTALIKIAGYLGFPYSLLAISLIFPKLFRDIVYDFIARHRYRWFGKRDSCRIK